MFARFCVLRQALGADMFLSSRSSLLELLLGQFRVVDNRHPLLNVACVSSPANAKSSFGRPQAPALGHIIYNRCGFQLIPGLLLAAFSFLLNCCPKLEMRQSNRLMRCTIQLSTTLSLDGVIKFKRTFRVLKGPPSVGFPVSLSLLSLLCNTKGLTLPALCSRTL